MLACLIASVVMGIVAAIVNYFILLPVFVRGAGASVE